jgi:hypothetical protein
MRAPAWADPSEDGSEFAEWRDFLHRMSFPK